MWGKNGFNKRLPYGILRTASIAHMRLVQITPRPESIIRQLHNLFVCFKQLNYNNQPPPPGINQVLIILINKIQICWYNDSQDTKRRAQTSVNFENVHDTKENTHACHNCKRHSDHHNIHSSSMKSHMQ